jgi:hypothetical protein
VDALDVLDDMDVVTSVVTDPAGGADTMGVMSIELDDHFDPAELFEEKRRSREEDRRALASGEKSLDQLREENEVFARALADARINLAASKSLG